MGEYLNLEGKRHQSSLGKQLIRNTNSRKDVNTLTIGRVVTVNYVNHTVDFIDLNTGASYTRSSSLEGKQSARMPVSFSGRNGNGNPYGDITPINTGDLILVGFINGDGSTPIVIAIMGEDSVMESLSRDPNNATDNKAVDDQPTVGQHYTVYPDQTYHSKDGVGNEITTYPGKTFLSMRSDKVNLQNNWGDKQEGPMYRNIETSYLSDGTLIEPLNPLAPDILLKHQGIFTDDTHEVPDTHETLLAVNQTGDARVSAMDNDDTFRGYLEVAHDGSMQLRFQPTSKDLNSSNGDEVFFKLSSTGININVAGKEYNFGDGSFVIGSGNDAIDIAKTVIDNNQQQETIIDQIEDLENGYQENSSSIKQLADEVAINVSEVTSKNDIIFMLYGDDATKINLVSLNLATMKSVLNPNDGTATTDETGNGLVSSFISSGSRDDYWASAYSVPNGGTLGWAQYDSKNVFIRYDYVTSDKDDNTLSSHILTEKNTSYIKVSYTYPSDSTVEASDIPLVKLARSTKLTGWTPSPNDLMSNTNVLRLAIAKANGYHGTISTKISGMNEAVTALQSTLKTISTGAITSAKLNTIKSAVKPLEDTYLNLYKEATRVGVDATKLTTAYTKLNNYVATLSTSRVYDETTMKGLVSDYQKVFSDVGNASKEQYEIIATNLQGTLDSLLGSGNSGAVNYALGTGSHVKVNTAGDLYTLSQNIGDLKTPASLAFNYSLNKLEQVVISDSTGANSYTWNPTELTGSFFHTFSDWKILEPTVSLKVSMATNTEIDINKLIISFGNSETSWQAAPEDLSTYIDDKFSEFKVTSDMITSEVYESITNNTLNSSKYQENYSKIIQTSEGLETLISSIGSGGSTLKNYIDQTAGGLTASITSTNKQTKEDLTALINLTSGGLETEFKNGLSGLDSKIEQTANSIKNTVTKAELTTAKSEWSSAQSTITAGQISTEITKVNQTITDTTKNLVSQTVLNNAIVNSETGTKQVISESIANISVGGRNYLPNTAFDTLGEWSSSNPATCKVELDATNNLNNHNSIKITATQEGGFISQTFYGSFNAGDKIIISFWAKSISGNTSLHTEIPGSKGATDLTITTDWKRYVVPVQYVSGGRNYYWLNGAGVCLINSPKLESGTQVTDWTPAPEDIKQGIPGKPGIDGKTPYLHTAWADSADGKINFSLTDATNRGYLGTYTDFEQADSKDPTKYAWTELVGNLAIGGRNYIKNSDQTITINGDTQHYISIYGSLTNEYWTFSADVKYTRGTDTSVFLAIYSADTAISYNNASVPIVNGKIAWTFKPNDPAGVQLLMYASSGAWWTTPGKTLEVSHRKLEKGNKSTDWTPAPEDQASVTAVNTIEQTVNGMKQTIANAAAKTEVTALAGQVTSVVSTANGNSSQITQLQSDINLRVQNGDVINQINISPESILIAGSKIHITGDTYFEKGVIRGDAIEANSITAAQIKSGAITTDKLQANWFSTGFNNVVEVGVTIDYGGISYTRGSKMEWNLGSSGLVMGNSILSYNSNHSGGMQISGPGGLMLDMMYATDGGNGLGLRVKRTGMVGVGLAGIGIVNAAMTSGIFFADDQGFWIGQAGNWKKFDQL